MASVSSAEVEPQVDTGGAALPSAPTKQKYGLSFSGGGVRSASGSSGVLCYLTCVDKIDDVDVREPSVPAREMPRLTPLVN